MSTGVSVARALGSTTRAGIYEHLKQADGAFTVRDVAEIFDLHPNVARTHLGLLADAGLVSVGRRKHPGGGRPAKIYRARPEVEAEQGALDAAAQPAGGAAAALVVRMLVHLLDDAAGAPLVSKAHDTARDEGRRLVASLPGPAPHNGGIEGAAQRAVRALRAYAADARVSKAGKDWAEVTGLSSAVTLVERVDPALAEALERGLLAGACAAAGAQVLLSEVGLHGADGRTWRLEAAGTRSSRTAIVPAASLDTRDKPPEAGVVEAMRTVTRLRPGDVLEVLAEGPGSPARFARWADRAGHVLLAVERAQDATGRPAIRLLIQKA